jgi:hypothetical protein
MKWISQFLEHLNIAKCTDSFLSEQEIKQDAPAGIPEHSSHSFPVKGKVLAFVISVEAA